MLLDTSSLLRSPGESVVVQMLVAVRIGDDISVCCTWDRRCGSLTILKDTCERQRDRGHNFRTIWSPINRQFAQSILEASLAPG